jgi:cysteine desulfurase
MLYFDHNATSPLIPEARDAWLRAAEEWPANPSSPHRAGSRASNAMEEARSRMARILGCDALDLVWTSGASESNNQAMCHVRAGGAAEVWVSAVEHPSLLEPALRWFGAGCRLLPVGGDGVVRLEALDTLWASAGRPALVAVMAANNETGVIQPWGEVLRWCRERGIPFLCDASQWLGKLPAAGLGAADFVTGCAHKFGGPRGVGFLKCPVGAGARPLLLGGPQEEGRRAGTENLPGVMGMVAALEVRERGCGPEALARRLEIRRRFEHALLEKLPGASIVAREADRLWNTVPVLMPAADCRQRWVVRVDRLGAAVSTGSACASGAEKPSHVLRAMGVSPADAGRMLRLSSGWEARGEDWEQLLAILVAAESSLAVGREAGVPAPAGGAPGG